MSKSLIQKNSLLVGLILFAMVISYTYFNGQHRKYSNITSFEACVSAGFPIMESYPERCSMPGKIFTNQLQIKDSASTSLQTLNQNSAQGDSTYKNRSYTVDGQQVTLQQGVGALTVYSSSKQVTTPIVASGTLYTTFDINNDASPDSVFFLYVDDIYGGSRSEKKHAWYITSSVSLLQDVSGTNALYIGESIVSTDVTYSNNRLQVTYKTSEKDRAISKKYYTFKDEILKEITP